MQVIPLVTVLSFDHANICIIDNIVYKSTIHDMYNG